jgi:hypothetical protein
MQTVLGHAVFSLPDAFRDRTLYIYKSADETWVLRVTPGPGVADVDVALEAAKQEFVAFLGDGLIYIDDLRTRAPAGAPIRGYEGEILDPPSRARFALFAKGDGTDMAIFLLKGAGPDFIKQVLRLHASVQFVRGTFDPTLTAGSGMTRHQAVCASFEIPASWSAPLSRDFIDTMTDDVRIQVALDEPASPEGSISLASELPAGISDTVTVAGTPKTTLRPNPASWTGEWRVQHTTRLQSRTVDLRKACILLPHSPDVVTARGQADAANAGRLTPAWETLLQTIRARTP